jgi:hypothetical protein
MCYVLLRGIDCADGHGDFSWVTLGATVVTVGCGELSLN